MALDNDGRVVCPRTQEIYHVEELEKVYVMWLIHGHIDMVAIRNKDAFLSFKLMSSSSSLWKKITISYVTPPSKSNRLGAPWRIHYTLRHCVPAPHLLMDFQEQYTKRKLISTAILLGINFENPSITVEPGRNGVTCSGFVKMHPRVCFCSKRSHI